MKAIISKCVVSFLMLILGSTAYATWHYGKVRIIAAPYEGDAMAFTLTGIAPGCSCPNYWTDYMCLDVSRATYSQEYALLLSAKARDMKIHVNVNDTTCMVTSMYESW